MIDRAATAARTSLVMAVAPSRLGSAPGSALGSALGGSARIRCLGSVLGFASVFITCEAGVAERRENGGERNHTAKIFFAGHRATARVRTGSHRSRDWVTEVLAYGTAVLVQPGGGRTIGAVRACAGRRPAPIHCPPLHIRPRSCIEGCAQPL